MTGLTRWNPIDEITSWWPRSLFSRDVFSSLRPDGTVELEWSPRCDVTEDETEIVVHAEIPGVDAKDMEVALSEGMLRIRGEKRTEKATEDKGQKYTERFFGSFERRIALPSNVDATRIDARLRDGVLEVHIPRTPPPEPEAKKIEIKTA